MSAFHEWREAPPAEFAVIGDPIAHSLSPSMHRAAYRALGLALRYEAIRVPRGEVSQALSQLRDLGYRGVNVTVPHKEEAFFWLSDPDESCRRIRSANTLDLVSGRGTSTDGPGFLDTLEDLGVTVGARFLILGAGGTARALVDALARAGYGVKLWNRTYERAEELRMSLGLAFSILKEPAIEDVEVIVDATSASRSGQSVPLDWSRASPGALAYDLSYGPTSSAFLGAAEREGLRTVDGKALLVAQGARSLAWWLGVGAPRAAMREALG
ncbi:MAG: shikimate dehydrogenase [Armatimonadetes bacterium]|nr:shikimate dehydrogenase [Armatimonadota bacterium]